MFPLSFCSSRGVNKAFIKLVWTWEKLKEWDWEADESCGRHHDPAVWITPYVNRLAGKSWYCYDWVWKELLEKAQASTNKAGARSSTLSNMTGQRDIATRAQEHFVRVLSVNTCKHSDSFGFDTQSQFNRITSEKQIIAPNDQGEDTPGHFLSG